MPWWAKWGMSLLIAVSLIYIGWRYTFVLVTLHVLVCFVLVIVIMLQSGSAADLAGAFGGAGSQTAFGPRGAASFLSRATTWCAIVFMMTSLTLSVKRAPTDVGTSPAPFSSRRRNRRPIRSRRLPGLRCKRPFSLGLVLLRLRLRLRLRHPRKRRRRIKRPRRRNNHALFVHAPLTG